MLYATTVLQKCSAVVSIVNRCDWMDLHTCILAKYKVGVQQCAAVVVVVVRNPIVCVVNHWLFPALSTALSLVVKLCNGRNMPHSRPCSA